MKLMSEGDWSFHLPSSLRTYVTEALPYELAALCFLLSCQAGKGIAGFGNWPHHSIDSEKRTDFVNLIKSLKTCSPNLRQRTSGQSWCGKSDLGLWSGVSSSRKFWKLNEFFCNNSLHPSETSSHCSRKCMETILPAMSLCWKSDQNKLHKREILV